MSDHYLKLWHGERQNHFVRNRLIPLGVNTYRGTIRTPIIALRYHPGSDTAVISGLPRTGKSVLTKLMYSFEMALYRRPGSMIDVTGEDHWLSIYPNSITRNIPCEPFGMGNIRSFCPVFSDQEKDDTYVFESVYGYAPEDLNEFDYMAMRFTPVGAYDAERIAMEHGETTEEWFQTIKMSPTSEFVAERKNMSILDVVHPGTYPKLVKDAAKAIKREYLVDKGIAPKPDFGKMIQKGFIPNIAFFDERGAAPAYCGKFEEELFNWKRKHKDFPPPLQVIEEADLFIPYWDSNYDLSSTYWIIKMIRRGQKYGWKFLLVTQNIWSLHDEVKENINMLITARVRKKDLDWIYEEYGHEIRDAVKNLRWRRDMNIREFAIIYPDGEFGTFIPFNCPVALFQERQPVIRPAT